MELDLTGVSLVIAAVGVAASSIITALRTAKKVDAIYVQTTAIDNAVNQKQPGEQTIGKNVDDLHIEMEFLKRDRD